uniref:Letm1 RBD domain-containing protein n=1 Tax=Strigamia maritima TaxID=126957 RepID=T1IV40_STRMM
MEYLISHSYKKLFRTPTAKYSFKNLCAQYPSRIYESKNCRYYSCLRYKHVCVTSNPASPKWLKGLRKEEIPNATALTSVRDFSSGSSVLLKVNYDDTRSIYRTQLLLKDFGPNVYIFGQQRNLSVSPISKKIAEGEKSKVEQTVEALKVGTGKPAVQPKKQSLLKRIWHEVLHYYHGFRLLGIDMKVGFKLGLRMARGKTLSRREHQLLIRTVSDVFRLVPFSVFIFVPLAELTLPLALKLFPNMLPSTFQTKDEKMQKLKTQLKVKLEVAKFLQDTLDQMSLQTKGEKNSQAAQQFKEFFTRIRSTGIQPTTDEILKFSKLFKDDLTLDNLPRGSLLALCRMLELHSYGPSSFLTFQLRMTLRNIKSDDRMIYKEGADKLTTWELQQALKTRGIRAIGYSDTEMRSQLNNWLDLSLKRDIPPSLLLLTRAMAITDVMPGVEELAATIKELPATLGTQAEASLGEMEGKVDNKIRLQLVKEEEKKILEEQKERDEMQAKEEAIMKDNATNVQDPAVLANKEGISTKDLDQIEGAIESMASERKKLLLEKEELSDLKAEVAEYQEDLAELQQEKQKAGLNPKMLQESKAAQRVFGQINKIIKKMDTVIDKAEVNKSGIEDRVNAGDAKKEELVSITELVAAMRRLQGTPDNEKMKKLKMFLLEWILIRTEISAWMMLL